MSSLNCQMSPNRPRVLECQMSAICFPIDGVRCDYRLSGTKIFLSGTKVFCSRHHCHSSTYGASNLALLDYSTSNSGVSGDSSLSRNSRCTLHHAEGVRS